MASLTVRDYLNAGGTERNMQAYLAGEGPLNRKVDLNEVLADDAEGRHRSKYFSTVIHEVERVLPPPLVDFIACGRRK